MRLDEVLTVLTARERQICVLAGDGLTTGQIAPIADGPATIDFAQLLSTSVTCLISLPRDSSLTVVRSRAWSSDRSRVVNRRKCRLSSSIMEPMKLDLIAAKDRTLPDILPVDGAPLHVLFCGINPGLYSAATGWHFARPGNRFWPALHLSGFTPRRLEPREQDQLPGYGLGITNIAPRATAQAAELSDAELRDGAARLRTLAETHRPRFVAIAGVTAYGTAFGRPRAAIGPQDERLGPARLWILPNPSGLNAHWTLPSLSAAFAELKAQVPGDSG